VEHVTEDGVVIVSPALMILRATQQLNAAVHQVATVPWECSPGQMPGLLLESYRALVALTALVDLLRGTDLDPQHRAELQGTVRLLAQALTRMSTTCLPPAT
jgi:hypothetical protein